MDKILENGKYIYILESVISPCLVKIGKTDYKGGKNQQSRLKNLSLHGYQGVAFKRVLAMWKISDNDGLDIAEAKIAESVISPEKGKAKRIADTELFVFENENNVKNFILNLGEQKTDIIFRDKFVPHKIITDINRQIFDDYKELKKYFGNDIKTDDKKKSKKENKKIENKTQVQIDIKKNPTGLTGKNKRIISYEVGINHSKERFRKMFELSKKLIEKCAEDNAEDKLSNLGIKKDHSNWGTSVGEVNGYYFNLCLSDKDKETFIQKWEKELEKWTR